MPFIGKAPDVGAFRLIDSITTSATDTYALQVEGLSYFPSSARNLIVSLNGVTQAPETAYTVSGSNIVFASALTASDVIDYILVIGDAVDIGTPSDGTVGNAQLKSSLDFSGKTLTFSNDQISGDAIDGGTATLDGLTVDTTTLVVDSTNNRVNVGNAGTVTPYSQGDNFVIDAGGTDDGMSIIASSSSNIFFGDAAESRAGRILYLHSDDSMRFYTNGNNNRMTVASSGKVGIGQSNPESKLVVRGVAGSESRLHISSGSAGQQTFDGSGSGLLLTATNMNTTSKFTPAIQFGTKDVNLTTTNPKVGAAINAIATETYSNDDDGGMALAFYTTSNNPGTGQTISERMRILSTGGITFNGETTAAHALDDYEEGTCNISFSNAGTNGTFSGIGTTTGFYTKIGNLVTVCYYSGAFTVNTAGSGWSKIDGLPFLSSNGSTQYPVVQITHSTCFNSQVQNGYVQKNSTYWYPIVEGGTSSPNWSTGSNKYLMFSVTYFTDQ
jgi:hypothetical protein